MGEASAPLVCAIPIVVRASGDENSGPFTAEDRAACVLEI
jgi:hypothetical protein